MNAIDIVINFFKQGGVFLYPIAAVFVLGLGDAVERFIYLRKVASGNRRLWAELAPLIEAGNFRMAMEVAGKTDSALSPIMRYGMSRIATARRRDDIEKAMEESLIEVIPRLEKRTHYLATLANIGMLMGLLGTVIGLINAFAAVARVNPSEKAALLSAEPAVELAGGRTVRVPLLRPGFGVDWGRVHEAINPRTRLLIGNSPHNPTGAVFGPADLDALEDLVRDNGVLLLSDEVYEHIVFDGRTHQSLLTRPALAARSFVVSSFGKTYHCTGWKVGYCVAPPALMAELRKVHQFVQFAVAAPMQAALAQFIVECPGHALELATFYQGKRDRFLDLLAGTPPKVTCQHIGELYNKSLKHGSRPEALTVKLIQRPVAPPNGEDRECKIQQGQWMQPEPDDTGPIRSGRLAGIDIKVNSEDDDLDQNWENEFNHIFDQKSVGRGCSIKNISLDERTSNELPKQLPGG